VINKNFISEISNLVFQVRGDKNDNFGTAFAILAKDGCTYFVTCQHVITEIESQNITIGLEYNAQIVGFDDVKDGFDVAILKIDIELDLPFISLAIDLVTENKMVCVGFFLNGAKQKVIKSVSGNISNDSGFVESKKFNKRIKYWELDIEPSSGKLQKGYSGSPVIDIYTNSIIGIVNMMMKDGEKGSVISIEVLTIILPRLETSIIRKIKHLPIIKKNNFDDFQLNRDKKKLMDIVFNPKYSHEYDFFYQRTESIFENKIDFFIQIGKKNIWIHGDSGVGKTTLLVRKALKSGKKFHYYYALVTSEK
jgi:Trypsin-like peptidase domain